MTKSLNSLYFSPLHTLLFAMIILAGSCTTSRSTAYFQNISRDTTLVGTTAPNPELKIVPYDNLSIHISSLNPVDDNIFNAPALTGTENSGGYVVDKDGKIQLRKLGQIQAGGMTRRELANNIQQGLLPFLKDPIVTVQFLNHKVTVFGEVGSPKIVNMPEEKLALIDAVVSSGGLNANSAPDRIMVIREEGDKKIVKYVSLQDNSLFLSPWYYVQPNDVVYVAPDDMKKQKEEKKANVQRNIGFITAGASFLFLIIDRITR